MNYVFGANATAAFADQASSFVNDVIHETGSQISSISPMTKFVLTNLPFFTAETGADDVAAEELAFVRNIGSILTYATSGYLVIYHYTLGQRINRALTASSIFMYGLTKLINGKEDDELKVRDPLDPTQPGILRGGYGGLLTLILTGVSMSSGYLLENDKMLVPKFWTPMTALDDIVDKAFEFGTSVI